MTVGNQQYYHGIMRKYVAAFGSLFADITVQRRDDNEDRVQTIAVPLAYGPKQAWLVRANQEPDFDNDVAITLPRIGFEIGAMVYNPTRKHSSTHQNRMKTEDSGFVKTQYVPVPYDITFQLAVFVKNADDGMQIIEQILPYFRPEYTVNINLVPEMGIVKDIPIELQAVSIEDSYDGDFLSRRALIYNIDFIMKGYLYGPISSSGVITRSITNLYDDTAADTDILEKVTVTPTQYANGSPLFSPSGNSALSVAASLIDSNTDFGFSTDIEINTFNINNS